MMSGHIFPDINRPFASCPKPLFHNEAKCEAIDMKILFFILMQIKLIFTTKVLHLAYSLIFKVRVLELRNGLLQTLHNTL